MPMIGTLRRLLLVLVLVLPLTGCEIQGGALTAVPATNPNVAQTLPTPETTVTPTTSGLRIGVSDLPNDLFPYHTDSTDQRQTGPMTQLIFPPPLLSLGYTYTTTGVLERVPSFANGDVATSTIQIYLDETGFITTTVTAVYTTAVQLGVTFHWNHNLRWSDGTPLTATDSVFAYELARRTPFSEEVAARLEITNSYEMVDAYTTRALLKPNLLDPTYLNTVWTPLPRHLLKDVDPAELIVSPFALNPVGYGPYTVARRSTGSIRLVPNPAYEGTPLPFASIEFVDRGNAAAMRTEVQAGALDMALIERFTSQDIQDLQTDALSSTLQLITTPGPVWEHLDLNLDVPQLQDIKVRRAIGYGVNRPALVRTLLGGTVPVLESWLLPAQWAAAPADQISHYAYDPTLAKSLLDEAGYVDSDGDAIRDRDGQPLGFELLTTEGTPLRIAAAEQVKQDLATIGISVTVRTLPSVELYTPEGPLFTRQFQLVLFAWIAGSDPGGLGLWGCSAVPSESNGWGGNNFAGWCFREADQAIRTANTTIDQAQRQAAYLRQQQLFTQELPALPLFQRPLIVITNPKLRGIRLDPLAPITWNIAEWQR